MTFRYFGYGSNMNLTALRAKGVEPLESAPAELRGWRLRFNVRHWFRHEGGMANIEPSDTPGERVLGVVHRCRDEHLPRLDALEACGVGYDRGPVTVETREGSVEALTYRGLPAVLDDRCLPTRRYMNILLRGAREALLDPAYLDRLEAHPLHPPWNRQPFTFPDGEYPEFDAATLARHPDYTAVAGAVFDMAGARPELDVPKRLFGGMDTTLFHLKRLDTSDGTETLDDVREGRVSEAGRIYLNEYLHEFAREFRYVGRYRYD
ncbi:MAG: gamma-glutamylcyclotransferase [Gemmatimonadales bacterium]|nr:MAG: gamma-glutamylcyclotransferase [Gemmatimonadales bacterium]